MKTDQQTTIDFTRFDGPLYSSRSRGERARITAGLDALDKQDCKVKIVLPKNFLTITSSFFLGMFGKSIQACNSRDVFLQKFDFTALPESLIKQLPMWIDRALTPNTRM